ncbi:hypothetical protein EVB27_054 [Rhizobium phage RHph_TM16]|nr:hypothetical protein EVB27_054 [Rhizobium phage RHph_TM16]
MLAKTCKTAKVGDTIHYNLTDTHRSGFEDQWKFGVVTAVGRTYLTVDKHAEFNRENGIRRLERGFCPPGIAMGEDERMLYDRRQDMRKLAAKIEYCKDVDTVRTIARLLDFKWERPL